MTGDFVYVAMRMVRRYASWEGRTVDTKVFGFGEAMNILTRLDNGLERFLQWMWRHRKALGAALAVLVAAYALGGLDAEEEPGPSPKASAILVAEEAPTSALYERLWIDHLPRGHKDSFRMYFFLKRHPVGVHLLFHSATYRTQEFFQYELKGKQVTFDFPDPGVKPSSKVRFENVKGDPHFDMKVTLERDPQTKGVEYSYFRLKQEAAADLLASYGVSEASLEAALGSR